MDIELKLITKDTDLSKLKITRLDWDVVVGDVPYYVVQIEGYYHSSICHMMLKAGNDLWAYPRNEEMSYENLVEWDNTDDAVRWGIHYEPAHYIKSKYGETEIRHTAKAIVTRNGKPFYTTHSILEAQVAITKFYDHPLNLDEIDFDEKMKGRKIWWHSQPAIIDHFLGDGSIIIKPDGKDAFDIPPEDQDDEMMQDYYEECESELKVDILQEDIYWFRE